MNNLALGEGFYYIVILKRIEVYKECKAIQKCKHKCAKSFGYFGLKSPQYNKKIEDNMTIKKLTRQKQLNTTKSTFTLLHSHRSLIAYLFINFVK